jgi:hypothetical protein
MNIALKITHVCIHFANGALIGSHDATRATARPRPGWLTTVATIGMIQFLRQPPGP